MLDRLRRLPGALMLAASALYAGPRAKTGNQSGGGNDIATMIDAMGTGCFAHGVIPGGPTSTWAQCPSASLKTWRRIAKNPTVALALAAAKAPVQGSEWTVTSDDDAPAGAEELISEYAMPLRAAVMSDGLKCVEFGHYPFEIVWDQPADAGGKLVPCKLKPLLPDITDILIDDKTGAFLGLDNKGVKLSPMDSFVVHADGEAGDMHGQSRLENIRETAWWPWEETNARLNQYIMKAAGILPMVRYPVGRSLGAGGVEKDNGEIAASLMASIRRGNGIAMPNIVHKWAEGMIAKGMDPTKLLAWTIEFLEARNLHGGELKDILDKREALMVRGILSPERALLEGNNGTKAEAGVHGDVAVSVGQKLQDQVVTLFNWHLVDKVLVLNYGPAAAGKVRVEAAPLADEKAALLREIMRSLLTAPGNIDIAATILDMVGAAEQLGLPLLPGAKAEDVRPDANEGDVTGKPDAGDKPKPDPSLAASLARAGASFRMAG